MTLQEVCKVLGKSETTLISSFKRTQENLKKYNENIFIDLTGQKFGYLTVLEKSDSPKNPSNKSTILSILNALN